MNTSIQFFKNPKFGSVRVANINEGDPLFCLSDLCDILELTSTKVATRLTDDVLSKHPIIDNLGRKQLANFVNEDGLYDVILDSRKPEARKFRKWVTSEVLPTIRRSGGYMVSKSDDTPESIMARALLIAKETMDRLSKQLEEQAPQVLFAKAVETSQKSCLIAELAKLITQNGVNTGQNRLFKWMRENGFLCTRGDYYNQPTQRAMDMSLFEIKKTSITKPNGDVIVTTTPKVTGKGQIYFVNRFLYNESRKGK